MWKNYLKSTWRALIRNKGYALINTGGLAIGLAVALLIGLWVWDELSFDRYHGKYDRIAQVIQNVTNNGEIQTWETIPYPLADELRDHYGHNFKMVVLSTFISDHLLSAGEKVLTRSGGFIEPEGPELLSLKMLRGNAEALQGATSLLLSASTAQAFFGDEDPLNREIKIDDDIIASVSGVYEDLPENTTLSGFGFMAPWQLFYNSTEWVRTMEDPWRPNAFHLFVELADDAAFAQVSENIRDAKLKNLNEHLALKKPALFLHPMSQWHLYSEFRDGLNVGGRIKYVWLFGVIGVFVLLMACINFMNLSTAQSEKRAKEVGVRKVSGSTREQLMGQFLGESVVTVAYAFVFSLALISFALPYFNQLAGKNISLPLWQPLFWLVCAVVILLTGSIAGSYPAFYLSSFQPVTVLKGAFKAGRWAALPRKVLIVLQFTISVVLIIGTMIVFQQIEFARSRPIGYSANGLVSVPVINNEIHSHFDAVKTELLNSNAITEMAESDGPVTSIWATSSGFSWRGKDPNLSVDFPFFGISYDFGKTIGWNFREGRDFSRDFPSDSAAVILNEAAVRFMGLEDPLAESIEWNGQPLRVIGVVEDLIASSPYRQVPPSFYLLNNGGGNFVELRINPEMSATAALGHIETVFRKFNPAQPFEYQFVDEEFAKKFGNEERIGKLASCFAALAIFISCLGLFGLASFVAERRTKEVGIRKVLGASVTTIWKLLSKDFVTLVFLSCVLAVPISFYFLQNWLQSYEYHTKIHWGVFLLAALGALAISLLTVSYQSIRAALVNPVKSLRSE